MNNKSCDKIRTIKNNLLSSMYNFDDYEYKIIELLFNKLIEKNCNIIWSAISNKDFKELLDLKDQDLYNTLNSLNYRAFIKTEKFINHNYKYTLNPSAFL